MDKYEFNIKLEQIKKLKERKDYETCAKIADGIEWRKVKQWSVLRLVAECYELAGKYEDARDLRILGYNKNMGGRNNVYKIAELYVKTGDFDDAMELYEEYKENWPTDVDHYILLYTIKYAKDAPYTELIDILEAYLKEEINEKIMYELCELYEKTGQIEKCIKECDELFLWFGDGVFVNAALEMKKAHAELSPRQREVYDTLQTSIEKSADMLYDEDLDDDGKNNFFDFDITDLKEEEKQTIKEVIKEDKETVSASKTEQMINATIQEDALDSALDNTFLQDMSENISANMQTDSMENAMPDTFLQEMNENISANIQKDSIGNVISENIQTDMLTNNMENTMEENVFFKNTSNDLYAQVDKIKEDEAPKRDVALEERLTTRLDASVYIDINAACDKTRELPNIKRLINEESIEDTKENNIFGNNAINIEEKDTKEEFDGIISEEDELELIKNIARNFDNYPDEGIVTKRELPKDSTSINEEVKEETEQPVNTIKEEITKTTDEQDDDEIDESAYEGLKQFMDNEELASQIIDLFEKINEQLALGEGLKNMNLIISGNGSVNRQELVLALVKSIFESKGFMTRKIARITGDALNKKGIIKVKDKLEGTILIIESAGSANLSRIDELLSVMDELNTPPFVVLEDSGDKIDILLRRNPDVAKKFGGRIELMEYSVNDMVSMAKSYAHQKGYGISDKALLQLYLVLDNMHSKAGGINEKEVEGIIDKAIANSDKKGVNKVRKKLPMLNSKGVIMLTESDFK